MKIAYFDCFAGAAGDMILGAFLDAGLSWEQLQADLALLPCRGFRLERKRVSKQGIAGVQVDVIVEQEEKPRHLQDIRAILHGSALPEAVRDRSLAIFQRLAEAEARVHGSTVEEIHFHEVGATDAIIDVVGASCAFWRLGIEEAYASPLNVGSGFLRSGHGLLPVPGPATLELLRGVPVYSRDAEVELLTPTGAAILTSCCRHFGVMPPLRVIGSGYGAGSRDLALPNLLRVTIGEKEETPVEGKACLRAEALMMEANIDDMNPEFYDYLITELLAAGAMDVFLQPVQMKKNRPAATLCVLLHPEDEARFRQRIFSETTTLGLRTYPVAKHMLAVESLVLQTSLGQARIKIGRQEGKICTASPEYEDCRRLAREHGLPLKEVYARLTEECRRRQGNDEQR